MIGGHNNDRWAEGAVIGGIAGAVIGAAVSNNDRGYYDNGYYQQQQVTYSQPAPVCQTQPQVVYSQPAPQVVYTQPAPQVVYTQPAPQVVYAPAPAVVYAPAPAVIYTRPAPYCPPPRVGFSVQYSNGPRYGHAGYGHGGNYGYGGRDHWRR